VRVLNVAGPRESKRPGIYREARRVLAMLFR
jgi:Circularly permutated YpsA SLOG family